MAVIVIILKNYTHPGEPPAILREPSTGLEGAFTEGAVTIVVKQELLHAVVRHEYVSKAIAIVIGECYSQPAALLAGDARFLAHVLESSIALVVIENAGSSGKFFGRAVGVPFATARLAVLGIPLHVARDKQIQFPIIVIIEEA